MNQYLEVSVLDRPLGILEWKKETNEILFEFLPSFLENDFEISPVAYPKENLRKRPQIFRSKITDAEIDCIPEIFSDCLPGSFATRLLKYALLGTGKTPETLSPLSAFSLLGNRSIGAYSFEPHGYPELDQTEPTEIDRIFRVVHQIYQSGNKNVSEKRFRELLRCGLFTTGSNPEIFLAVNDFTGEVLSGQSNIPKGFEAWILKLDGILETEATLISKEFSTYDKALECGIDMAECRLLREGHHTHLLVKRIDRIAGERVHLQSFRALRDEKEDSYEAVFRCMRKLRLPYPEFVQMYKRMIFNVLINNTNESNQNIRFISHPVNEWHLAPAYGFSPTPWMKKYQLSVCGKNSNILIEDLIQFGKTQNIRKYRSIVETVRQKLGV